MAVPDTRQGGQQASTYAELTEHATISGVDGKKVFIVGSDGNQSDINPTYLTKIDEADASTTYVGDAVIGTASSSALWRIKKLTVSGTVTTIAWAVGASSFNQIWDNRASLSYS